MSFHERLSRFIEENQKSTLLLSHLEPCLEERDFGKSKCKKTHAFYETTLRSFVPVKEFANLGISATCAPLFTRGLPCLYCKEDRSLFFLEKEWRDLTLLKRRALDKTLWSLYANKEILSQTIVLVSWVVPGGVGDYYAAVETARVLKRKEPSWDIHLVVVSHRDASLSHADSDFLTLHSVVYDTKSSYFAPKSSWTQELLALFSRSDLILQIPMYYPPLSKVCSLLSKSSLPIVDLVREYGFIFSRWLSCPNLAKSMGLHGLEMGIFIKEVSYDEKVFLRLIRRLRVGKKFKEQRPFFAYLITGHGYEAFLHAILTYTDGESRGIDLYVHQMAWYLMHFDTIRETIASYGISKVIFHTAEKTQTISLSGKGKSLRLIHTGVLSHEEFESLLLFCDPFVGCRGDQSFSEMVSADKVYFYDGLQHAVDFLKDLVSLCNYYLPDHPSTLAYLRLFLSNMAHLWKEDARAWVDEEYFAFPGDESAEQIGKKMGMLLKDPSTTEGMLALNCLLKERHDLSPHLTAMVKRALIHKEFPDIAQKEEEMVQRLLQGKKDFSSTIRAIRRLIAPIKASY
jgi:hypothetical protein